MNIDETMTNSIRGVTMYTSTRKALKVNASQAILKGLSQEGGLFVPCAFDASFFNQTLLQDSYLDLTKKVFKVFLDDFDDDMIEHIVSQAYGSQFRPSPVVLNDIDGVSFLELFHGPTFAFKDMALQVLPVMIQKAKTIQKDDKKTIILTATSGDTGGACLSGFHDMKDTDTIVLYPRYGISQFQEKQMLQYQSKHCHVIGIEGNFDDCQNLVKEVFVKADLKASHISSANSINIGRIIAQTVYYIYAYLEEVRRDHISFGDPINVTVPTGNFGNIYAAYVAKHMGLPIQKLIVASNDNNVLTDVFQTNTYNIDRVLMQTISPSMDIIISSNVERLLYALIKDPDRVNTYMHELKQNKSIHIKALKDTKDFYATFATEAETKKAIKYVYDTHHYIMDPHTAVAYQCYQTYLNETNDHTKTIIVSTASPYKFSDAVLDALNITKTNDLKKDIIALRKIDHVPFDDRILDVLTSKDELITMSLENARDKLLTLIGDIDAND